MHNNMITVNPTKMLRAVSATSCRSATCSKVSPGQAGAGPSWWCASSQAAGPLPLACGRER
jgi:hypothetical protein